MNFDNKILIIINVFLMLYICKCMNKNIEKMSDTADLQETIKEEIEKIYKADVESIRNLGSISKKLMDGGLEIPGNVMIKGNLTVDNDSNVKGNMTVDNNSNVKGNSTVNGNITVGSGRVTTKYLTVTEHAYTKRLDISAGRGTTHFNYKNEGKTYFRDTVHDTSNIRNGLQPAGNYLYNNNRVIIRSDHNDSNKRRHLQHHPDKGSHDNARFDNTNTGEFEWMRIFKI